MARKPLKLNLKRNALHAQLGVPVGQKIPKGRLRRAAHSTNTLLARRAQFAINAAKWGR
jgi:hypothetical protein